MIKAVDATTMISNRTKVLNLAFCAAPTVYEETQNYAPAGRKLNVTSIGACKPEGCGSKLDKLV